MTEHSNRNFPLFSFLAFSVLILALLSGLFMLRQDELNADLDRHIAERQAFAQRTVENELARQTEIN